MGDEYWHRRSALTPPEDEPIIWARYNTRHNCWDIGIAFWIRTTKSFHIASNPSMEGFTHWKLVGPVPVVHEHY